MVRRNDTTDLRKFSIIITGIVIGCILFLTAGYFLGGKKAVNYMDAMIGGYIKEKLEAARQVQPSECP